MRFLVSVILLSWSIVAQAGDCSSVKSKVRELQMMMTSNQEATAVALGDVRRLLEDAGSKKVKSEQLSVKSVEVGELESVSYDQLTILDEKFAQLLQLLDQCVAKSN